MMVVRYACSILSMSIRVSVWRSVLTGVSTAPALSMCLRTCSSCAVCPVTFVLTMGRSLSPRPCRYGSMRSARRRPTSRRAARGRTDTFTARQASEAPPRGESFNARVRDELLNGELFYSLKEAQIIVESWRRHYNGIRPHSSLAYQAPAPEVFVPSFAAWPSPPYGSAPTAPLRLAMRPTLN
jgi:hypothetical protein